jgi:hypothetical protein
VAVTVRFALVLAAVAVAAATVARAERPDVRNGHRLGNAPRSRIVGEVRVISPARPRRSRSLDRDGSALRVPVPLTISDPRTGVPLERARVVTGRRFAIPIPPGTYRVSAQIGPPIVNPRPRSCGAEVVRARLRRDGRVLLYCTLTG